MRVDIDRNVELLESYPILSVPTHVLFVNGSVVAASFDAKASHAIEHDLGLHAFGKQEEVAA